MQPEGTGEGEAVREAELVAARQEVDQVREAVRQEEEKSRAALALLDTARQEAAAAGEEARQAQELVEEMLADRAVKQQEAPAESLIQVVATLQSQLETQKSLMEKYEPRLKKREKENKELMKQIKQLRADLGNAGLEAERLVRELSDVTNSRAESEGKLSEMQNNEEEWKSLSDLLQVK